MNEGRTDEGERKSGERLRDERKKWGGWTERNAWTEGGPGRAAEGGGRGTERISDWRAVGEAEEHVPPRCAPPPPRRQCRGLGWVTPRVPDLTLTHWGRSPPSWVAEEVRGSGLAEAGAGQAGGRPSLRPRGGPARPASARRPGAPPTGGPTPLLLAPPPALLPRGRGALGAHGGAVDAGAVQVRLLPLILLALQGRAGRGAGERL